MKEFFKELYNRALYYLSVPKCISCGEILDYGDRALCTECLVKYREQKLRNCSRCSKVLHKCSCSNFFLERHYIKTLVKVYRYMPSNLELPGNLLVYSLKHDNRRDTLSFLADELSEAILNSFNIEKNREDWIITNVPRRPAAIRRDGYDHSAALAKKVATILGVEYKQFLKSRAKKAQREMKGHERLANASFDYRRGDLPSLKGKRIILVDDVVTTGSSLSSCATLLRGLGTKNIIGASVSIAYKDSYIKPEQRYY